MSLQCFLFCFFLPTAESTVRAGKQKCLTGHPRRIIVKYYVRPFHQNCPEQFTFSQKFDLDCLTFSRHLSTCIYVCVQVIVNEIIQKQKPGECNYGMPLTGVLR